MNNPVWVDHSKISTDVTNVVVQSNILTQIVGANASRLSLRFTSDGLNFILAFGQATPGLSASPGLFVGSTGIMEFTFEQWGDFMQTGFFAFNTGVATGCAVVEATYRGKWGW